MEAEYFDLWRPSAAQAAPCDEQVYCPYGQASARLALSAGTAAPITLGRFESTSTVAGRGPDGGSSPGDDAAAADSGRDALLYAGGPVWALDWCPAAVPLAGAAGGAASQAEYLAVGCHPVHATENVIGTTVSGPAVLQVWEVCSPAPDGSQPQQPQPLPPLPRMALGIAHEGGLVWQARWCPDVALAGGNGGSSTSVGGGTLPRLGLLAAALGDGSVSVWTVPQPRALPATLSPPLLRLPPCATVSAAQLGGSCPSAIDWLQVAPHDLLLVGCWDGQVALVKLSPGQATPGSGTHVLQRFPAETVPLRCVRFCPADVGAPAADLPHRHTFMTAGHEGTLKIWDSRDEFQPQYSQVLTAATVLDACWLRDPPGLLATLEDASLRGIALDAAALAAEAAAGRKLSARMSQIWRGEAFGAMWALAVHGPSQAVAYGGEDGVTAVFRFELGANVRKRVPHLPVAGLREVASGELSVLSQPELGQAGIFFNKVVERITRVKDVPIPPAAQALHRVAWAAGRPGGAWLAGGGAAGVVRLQWIDL